MFKNKDIQFKNINIYTSNCVWCRVNKQPLKNECVNQSIWFNYFGVNLIFFPTI